MISDAHHAAVVQELRSQIAQRDADYKALLEKYHAIKLDGGAFPLTVPSADPDATFGPLTRAALHDMSIGQTGMVKRKMREKASTLWLEQRGQPNQDEVVAIAVRRGDTVLL